MKKVSKIIPVLLATIMAVGVTACDNNHSSNSSSQTSSVVSVESVKLTSEVTTLRVNKTLQLVATISPVNATNQNVVYSTNNDNVEVSSTGLVTAKRVGTSIVTVKTVDGNKSDSITLQILEENPYADLDIKAYTDTLAESPYTVKGIEGKSKFGLSNGSNVGVIKSDIVEKYASISDNEVGTDGIINVDSITLADIKTIDSSVTETNNYYKIKTAIAKAKILNDNGKAAKIKFPTGKIDVEAYLSSTDKAIVIDGLNGTYFEGNDTTINIITKDLNWKGYINLTNSKNIHFNNISFSAEIPSNLTGKIVDGNVSDNYLTIEVDEEFNPLMQLVETKKPKIRSWVEFGQINKTPLEGGNFLVDDFASYEISKNDNKYTLKVNFKTAGKSRPRNGTLVSVQFSQYDASGINIGSSENIYFENVSMNHASGMAFVAQQSTNLYMNKFNLVIKENSASLMTATADATHFSLMHGDVHITNSIIEYSHDDAVNIKHGFWYRLSEAEGGSSRTISVTKLTGGVDEPKVGDKFEVYDEQTFESHNPSKGSYTIEEITPITNGYKFKVKERLANVGEWGTCRVTFVSNTPNFVFSNNIVRNKRNRGVLVQVPNAIITNNAFMYVGHGSIQVASAMDKYNEATLGQGIQIKNNKFIGNCYIKPEPLYGDISIFAISSNASVAPKGTMHGMVVENNFVSRNGNAAMSLRGVGSSVIKDNLFNESSYTQPSGDTFNTIFQLTNCGNLTLEGNYSNYTLGKGLSGWILEGTTAPSDITAKDNINIKERENGEAGPEVDVSKAKSSITIDGNLSDWDAAQALDITIDGVSDAEGTERTLEELQDHFKINKLKMTWDDKGIYFGFDVFDNEINVKTVNDFWLGDCVELFMSSISDMPNADMQVYKDYKEGGVLQVAFAPTWSSYNYMAVSSVRTKTTYVENKSLIQVAFVTNSSGYVGEVLIPFTFAPEFKTAIEAGKQIDIAIVVADAERTNLGLKRIQAGNIPHFVEDYKTKTARMPQYFFK